MIPFEIFDYLSFSASFSTLKCTVLYVLYVYSIPLYNLYIFFFLFSPSSFQPFDNLRSPPTFLTGCPTDRYTPSTHFLVRD
jgi:hypothetical protein